ncbi:MAG: EMC3/TMCO1 family protein [Candidatus Nanoarchaeia archaeon]|nr:EMC3/TMCO1 family protein [Candidatus Nanoarchaeia archaeon]
MVFDNFFNWMFGPIINNLSTFWSIVSLSFLITLFITIAYKFLSNQLEIKRLKDESKELRKEMKSAKNDQEKLLQIQKQSMQKSMEMFRHNMRPMLFYMIPLLLLLGWMSKTFKGTGELISWGFHIPLLGTGFGWLGVYILSAILFNMIIRKIFRVH